MQARQALLVLSCSQYCHARPLPWGPPAAFLIRRLQGKARQDTTRLSAAPARIIGREQRDAEFHVAGCRRTVGCGLEAPGGVGRCRNDWKSLEELGGQLPLVQGRLTRGAASLPSCLPACAATAAASDTSAGSWASNKQRRRGCERACVKTMSGRASADVQRTL